MLLVLSMNRTPNIRTRADVDAPRTESSNTLRRPSKEEAEKKRVRPELQVDIEEFYANPICTD